MFDVSLFTSMIRVLSSWPVSALLFSQMVFSFLIKDLILMTKGIKANKGWIGLCATVVDNLGCWGVSIFKQSTVAAVYKSSLYEIKLLSKVRLLRYLMNQLS